MDKEVQENSVDLGQTVCVRQLVSDGAAPCSIFYF